MEVVRGPGIPADSLDDLVDRPGSGLGLRIARQVARAHGGELLGESPGREGHATTFVLTVTR
ncbi:ATP-binding protein [Nocardioides halotolerans]|uniref:ATP-binding protein n=1 Tax=Nocardioides halotolerans TaxID=433660 RepID=UPI00040B59A4|nr:sensor histidine kinase [Nocardioides halotolerans]